MRIPIEFLILTVISVTLVVSPLPDMGDISTRSRELSRSSRVEESRMLEMDMVAPSPSRSVSVNMSEPELVLAMELSLLLRLSDNT